jgi:hypothetical protein
MSFDEIDIDQSKAIAAALRGAGAANLMELLNDPKHKNAADDLLKALHAIKLKYWQPNVIPFRGQN